MANRLTTQLKIDVTFAQPTLTDHQTSRPQTNCKPTEVKSCPVNKILSCQMFGLGKQTGLKRSTGHSCVNFSWPAECPPTPPSPGVFGISAVLAREKPGSAKGPKFAANFKAAKPIFCRKKNVSRQKPIERTKNFFW